MDPKLCFENESQYEVLRSTLIHEGCDHEREHGAFLLAAQAGNGDLEVIDIVELKTIDLVLQTANYLELRDDALQEMIVRAHRTNTALIEAHSHPRTRGPHVRFSSFDVDGLAEVGPHVSWRLPKRPYVALVFGRDAFDSLYWRGGELPPCGSVDLLVAGRLLHASGDSKRFWRQTQWIGLKGNAESSETRDSSACAIRRSASWGPVD